jgi:hypothetical protein
MIRLKAPLSVWSLRLGLVLAAAIVIPACGGGASTPPPAPFSITTSSLAGGIVGVPYTQTLETVSASGPVTWSLVGGTLPPGLALNPATGDVAGTPTGSASQTTVRVRALEPAGLVAEQALLMTVTGGAPAVLAQTSTSPLPAGEQGVFYSFGVSASGGAPPYTWAVTGGALPAGITLNPANGGLTGVPTAAGLFNVTLRLTDTALSTVSVAYALTIAAPLQITTVTLADGTVGGAYNNSVVSTGGPAPVTYALTSGTLPAGLTINPATGAITGVPTTAGLSSILVRVTDGAGVQQAVLLSITINVPPSVVTATLPASTQGLAYNQTLTGTGGTVGYTWTVSAGALPPGLSLSSGGVITGTSTLPGTFTFTALITDAANGTGSRPLSILINPAIVVTTAGLGAWTVNRPSYSQTLAATGGTGALTFSITGGTLPAGLTLNPATGVISGTPTVAATSNFTVVATDTLGATGSKPLLIVINLAPTISTPTLPDWTANFPYSPAAIAVTNGTLPFAFSVTVGGLPAAMTLGTSTGIVGGTPSTAGTSNFTIQVLDAAGAVTTQAYTIVINPAMAVTTASPLPQWTQNFAGYSQLLAATGGTGAKGWSVGAGLPTGITLSAAGLLSGTPTAASGTYNFTATVTDSVGATATKTFDLQINAPLAITTTSPIAAWTKDQAGYSVTLTATGGTAGKTWSNPGGGIPAGLTLSAAGVLSGTPTTAATSSFNVQVTDGVGATAPAPVSLSITVNPPLAITSVSPLAPWTQSKAGYSQTLTLTGGTGTKTWTNPGAGLPGGLSLSSAGVISGTPTAVGTFAFNVQVTDATTATAPAPVSLSITINAPLAITSVSPLAPWTQGLAAYSQTLTATGGTGAKTWSNPTGSLPTGLTLTPATGVISGTPTAAGTYTFDVQVTDAVLATAPAPVTLTIVINPPLAITTTSPIAAWTKDQAGYSVTLTATGGTGTKTWSNPGGGLPAGLSLSSAGVLSGTPTAAATSAFNVQVTDAVLATAPAPVSLSITINPPLVITTTSPIAPWTLNQAGYNQALAATGGTGTKVWSQTGGALPAGLTLDSSGSITGQPTASGTFSVSVQVTDATTATAPAPVSLSITINPVPSVTTVSPLATRTQDLAGYSVTLAATGGTGALNWSNPGGGMPTGLSLTAGTGLISGTPTAFGTYNFNVRVTDTTTAQSALAGMTISINPPVAITSTTPLAPYTKDVTGYSVTLTATGGTGALTWSNPTGSLPAGLTLASATGVISGTPTAAGTSTFTVQATDALAATAPAPVSLSITINLPPSITSGTPLPAYTKDLAGYSVTLNATGGTGARTWSLANSTVLPAGLTLTAATGVISGTPTAAATILFDVQVKDNLNSFSSVVTFSLTINPVVAITTASLPTWTQGRAYTGQTVAATGGTGSLSWDLVPLLGVLPTGLSLNPASGAITGTPTASGTFNFTVRASDFVGALDTKALSIAINTPVGVSTSSLADWTQFQSGYTQTLVSTGGTGAKTWLITGGSLPVGLSLVQSTGVISGTPTGGPSTYTVFVQATDNVGATSGAATSLSMTLNAPLNFTGPTTLPAWTTGQSGYSATSAVTGGTGTKTWSNPSGVMPLGLILNTSTGAITGTPFGAPGLYSFDLRVVDATTASTQLTFSITLNPAVAISTSATLPDGSQGLFYSVSFQASGGTAPYTWSSTTPLPLVPGMTLGSNGLFSGTPLAGGPNSFQLSVTDSAGSVASFASVNLFILSPLAIATTTLPSGTASTAYSTPVTASGGRTAYTFSLLSGTLPGGLSLDGSTGGISGTAGPTGGSWSFVVKVTDSDNRVATKALQIVINGGPLPLVITTGALPAATQNSFFSAGLAAIGGNPGAYSWSVASGSLPTGLTLNASTGIISGTPSGSTSAFFIALNDGVSPTPPPSSLSITVNGPLSVNTTPLADWTIGRPGYTGSLTSTGGTAPYTWSATGALPTGLTLNANGSFSGTPTASGPFNFTAQVSDGAGAGASAPVSITINPLPQIQNNFLAAATQGTPYPAFTLTVQPFTGTGPFTFTSIPNPPAAGLTLASGGGITGTPTAAGSGSVSFTVTDAAGATGNTSLNLTINLPPSITNVTLPDGTPGILYPSQQINTSDGTPGFSFAVSAGALPAGLSLTLGGQITGTPSTNGVYSFTVQATDSVGAITTKALSITIASGPTVGFQNVTEGQGGVSRGVNVSLGFSMAMDQSTFTSGAGGTVTLSPDPSGGAVPTPILFYWTSPTQVTLVFDTQLPAGIHGDDLLDAGTAYTLTLTTGVTSTPGTGSQALGSIYTLHFTTQTQLPNPTFTASPDMSVPVLAGTTNLVLTWDQPMDRTQGAIQVESSYGYKAKGTLGIGGVLNAGQSQGVASMSWNPPGTVLTMVLSTGVPANNLFRFSVNDFYAMTGSSYNRNNDVVFVTPGPAGIAPQPTGMLPTSGSTAPRDTQVILGFTAPMMPADLMDPNLIFVTMDNVNSLATTRELVDFSGVFITPVSPWPSSTFIKVVVKAAVRNAAGVPIGSDTVYTFTTEAADTTAMLIDAPFSTLANGTTDIDPYQFSAAFAFTRSGGLRAFVNGATLAHQDVSIVEHNAPNIPVKGYILQSNHGGLEIRSDYGWNGLQFSTQYDLTLNPTLANTYGGVLSTASAANVIGFTTRANSPAPTASRPVFFGGGGDTKYATTGGGGVKVELQTQVQSPTGATLTVTATDSPDTAFTKPLSASGGSDFQYSSEHDNGDNPEAALTTVGDHVVTYTVTDTVHTVSLSAKAFAFDSALYPSLTTPADSATPTLTWASLSPSLGAGGLAVVIMNDTGNTVYIVLLPSDATTFTLPSDQALPTGTYTFGLHFFHPIDGSFQGASSEADTNSSGSFNSP